MTTQPMRKGLRGGGITLIAQVGKLIIQFVSVVALSRLLAPEDFGLIAMAAVALALGELLRDFGMPLAALQRSSLDDQQASNMFWVNSALGLASGALMVLATPLFVYAYREPRLAYLTPALALTLLFNGVQAQLQVQLAREQRFFAINMTDLASQLIALAAAIIGAIGGLGYWALVIQVVLAPFLMLVLRVWLARWRPQRFRRGAGTRSLVRAGASIGAAQLLAFASTNIDTFLIGARFGPTSLGYYNRAFQLLTAPVGRLLGPLTQVVVPTFAVSDVDRSTRNSLLERLQFAIGAAGIWLFSVSAGVATPLVSLLLGPQWAASAPIFTILAIAGCFSSLAQVSYWAFLVSGRTRQLLYYNLVSKPLVIALVIGGSMLSMESVAWAYSIGLAISWPLGLHWLSRTAHLPATPFLVGGLRLLAGGAMAFGAAHWVQAGLSPFGPALATAGGLVVGTLCYGLVLFSSASSRRQLSQVLTQVQNGVTSR